MSWLALGPALGGALAVLFAPGLLIAASGGARRLFLWAVAPGISEALLATAIGLFVAIPAVWAYNRYATRVERLSVRYESFAEEFSSILQRQTHVD